jgi:hypothetical protein
MKTDVTIQIRKNCFRPEAPESFLIQSNARINHFKKRQKRKQE